jgi:hypothetical protein
MGPGKGKNIGQPIVFNLAHYAQGNNITTVPAALHGLYVSRQLHGLHANSMCGLMGQPAREFKAASRVKNKKPLSSK